MDKFSTRCAILACMLAAVPHAVASAAEETWPELSLGDLMKVGVESASRKSQSLSNTAAAAFVISAADIKRSGVLSIPEALRLAPGVEVAKLSNNKWAVSIRGFNGRMANKLLVLVDGRSIYNSLYGGVIWEVENMPLEEISRIEVIRGSAGLAWGSNAVNGVVNIITKRAQDTAGWLVDGHVGTSTGKAGGTLRYGSKMEDGSAFRVTLNEQRRDGGKEVGGKDAQDQFNDTSLSFRYDKPDGVDTRWLFSGRIFEAQSGDPWLIPTFDSAAYYNPAQYGAVRLYPFVSKKTGGDLLGRFEQSTDGGGEVRIQTYAEKFMGKVPGADDDRTTLDFDAQHRFPFGDAHDIVWGGNYRQSKHREILGSTGFLTSSQTDVTVSLASLFAQDEWTIVQHIFNMQAGVRIENQTYGGTTPQPSVRALWTPNEQHSFWFAWSKTVRSPSMVDRTMGAYPAALPATGPGTLPVLLYANAGEQSGFGNEKVRTLEAGHRAQWSPSFYSDLTAYVSHYDGVFGILPGSTMTANSAAAFTGLPVDPACTAAMANFGLAAGTPGLCQTLERGNILSVRTRGLELSTEWSPMSDWRLQINASRMWLDGGSDNTSVVYGNSPKYQGSVRSSYNFTPDRHFDLWLRRIGGLTTTSTIYGALGATPISARTELDLRFAEQVNESLELSLTLQNLLSRQQLQFYPDYMPSLPVVPQRTIYLKALWHGR
ncbi:MAG: TonB-dependent receptor [Gammaproteobacteria bacterium]|nr:TonB-dependent receptor [Gammaproteobacteria bacterium]MBU1482432.1 TonB-dependent receptor [Gammaproteobacteria bacterium]